MPKMSRDDYDRIINRGKDCICEMCGKPFFVPVPYLWTYKKLVTEHGTNKCYYFHTWSCYNKWLKKTEEQRVENRKRIASEAAKVRWKKAGKEPKNQGKVCKDCRYCMAEKFGFWDCSINPRTIKPYSFACRSFKEIEEEEEQT